MTIAPASLSGSRVARGGAALLLVLAGGRLLAATTTPPPPPEHKPPGTGPYAAETAGFEEHLKTYLDLHRKLEATLTRVPRNATPQQLDQRQRALGKLIQSARSGAKQGELFDHDMQKFVRVALGKVFGGPDGKELKASIMDENPGLPKLAVNDRYPDEVPLSTMPPQVLERLPKLPEDMEYRFVGDYFVLYDAHSHLIVDLMDDVLPV